MLSAHSDVSQAVAGPSQLQLCAVLGSSGVKLPEYMCSFLMSFLFQELFERGHMKLLP
jgi:hypothetical protein